MQSCGNALPLHTSTVGRNLHIQELPQESPKVVHTSATDAHVSLSLKHVLNIVPCCDSCRLVALKLKKQKANIYIAPIRPIVFLGTGALGGVQTRAFYKDVSLDGA